MTGDLIFSSYDLHSDTAANRPATPTVSDGRLYVFFATDTGVVSVWNGTAWVVINSGAPPTGSAGGDLGSTYPNPTVVATHLAAALPVAQGGTGDTTLTAHGILLGETTGAIAATAAMTDGQLLVGQAGADPLPKTISGSATLSASGVLSSVVQTRQVLTSGIAATYTTPAGVRQLRIRMIGGGGGGSGTGTTGPNNGGDGGDTIFNSVHAAGGLHAGNGFGGHGGDGGSGAASYRIRGAAGFPGFYFADSATTANYFGGNGGPPGNGQGSESFTFAAGQDAQANTGGGGGGASTATAAFATLFVTYIGGGGGHGEYVELIINAPSGTYTYTIGAAGTAGGAGTGGAAGGLGGTGLIIVDEYY